MTPSLSLAGLLALLMLAAHGPVGGAAADNDRVEARSAIAPVALPSLEVGPYMGTWYQVALFPNRFQKQCASDTSANYRQRADGLVEVLNRCKDSAGQWDEAVGLARPTGALRDGRLSPARLEVSFLPAWLRWLPVGWGNYWVLALAEDGRYAIVGEPTREYLWILSRTPRLKAEDDQRIRELLAARGYDLNRLQAHRHTLP